MQRTFNEEKILGFDRSIGEHRQKVAAVKSLIKPANVRYKDIIIPLGDVHISVRVYRSSKATSPYPTVFYVPGTAFVAREFAFTEVICSHIAESAGCQVILMSTRLAPEYQFPIGLNDAYNLLWLIVKILPALFQIDKNKIAIMGYSSGGNFVASMMIQAKKDRIPIALQILISPLVDLSRSLNDFKIHFEDKDTTITDAFADWFINLYLPKEINPKNPWASPFWHEPIEFQGLPHTEIICAEHDRFRSDSEGYYRKLKKAQVTVYKSIVEKADHSFLWHDLETIKAIGNRVNLVLIMAPRLYLSQQGLFSSYRDRPSESEEKTYKKHISKL